jgi:thioesterase domain-containing protein
MLVPFQISGTRPPLFFVHGMHGDLGMGGAFARALGPDQPFYAVYASGIDGRGPVIDNMPDMVRAYVAEIEAARPRGSVVLGGMCFGAVIAIAIARDLRQKGRHVAPLILADPPAVPYGFVEQNHRVDAKRPEVARQLYRQVRSAFLRHDAASHNELPFDISDAQQLHTAVLAGVGAMNASRTYVPQPYAGPAALIISAERAAAFFHPEMPWSRLLCGPRFVHVLPWTHDTLFFAGFSDVACSLRSMLERAPALEAYANGRNKPQLAEPEPASPVGM